MAEDRPRAAPTKMGEGAIETVITGIRGGLALGRLMGPSTNNISCNVCFKTIAAGELRYACLECYGWVPPESTTRNVRRVEVQQTQVYRTRGFTMETRQTETRRGYDLCSSCARNSGAHEETGHRFALWITR